jgi:hypothetical protein
VTLKDDLVTLAELDRRIVRAFIETHRQDLDAVLAEYLALRKNIRASLLDQTTVAIEDADAATTLLKITTGQGLPTDRLIKQLTSGQPLEEFDDDEMWALGSDHFYSWFSHADYIAGLAELRPLVVKSNVGEGVSQLIVQVKTCYAFQQYEAVFSLCRTLIEAGIRDICVRRKLFPDHADNVILFEQFNWGQLRDRVCDGALKERLKTLYAELSEVLHGRKRVSKYEAHTAFANTLQIVERLYANHSL